MVNLRFDKKYLILVLLYLANLLIQNYNLGKQLYVVNDEGIYLYSAKLLTQGFTPYKDFFLAQPPFLIYFAGFLLKILNFNMELFRFLYTCWAISIIFPIFLIIFKFTKSIFADRGLLSLFFIALLLRLALSIFPAFGSDQSSFRFWTDRLATLGPSNFYSSSVFTNNPLGILYFFWLIGMLKSIILSNFISSSNIDIFLKLAANISDLATGFIIYKIIKEKLNIKMGNIAALLYIFNPGFIFNSAVWGQYDSVAILFLLSSIYFCIVKKSPIICSFFFSLALITKPQSLQLAPFLIIYFLRNFKLTQWRYSILTFITTLVILFLPFFPNNPIYGIYYVFSGSTNLFNCTSCNALNLWGALGNWQNDMTTFFNISLLYWGMIFLIIFLIEIFIFKNLKENIQYFTISLSMLTFFMLLTRMHERYMAYFFPFLLIAAMLLKNKILLGFYGFFSLIFMLNLYIPYSYYNNLSKLTNLPTDGLFTNFGNFSLISFIGFLLFFIYYLKYVTQNKIT